MDFWSFVDKGGPPHPVLGTPCWVWTGRRDRKNYGNGTRGKLSHRDAWERHTGEDPGRMCVLHKCDNPPCCNPAHLFLGTKADNVRDMMNKRRNGYGIGESHGSRTHPESRARGERSGSARLTTDAVHAIRRDAVSGRSHGLIAKDYGVARQTISKIVNRKAWKHIE